MRIDPTIRDSVVFLGKTDSIQDLEATAFFARVESHLALHSYLVTARHVAEGLVSEVCIRINTDGGKRSQWIQIQNPHWQYHADPSVDAAVLDYAPPKDAHLTYVPTGAFYPADALSIGAGDEISYPGLLYQAAGEKRNLCLIRSGNLAMMPDEKIYTGYGKNKYALVYLAEVRSIRGLSGSPVFARETVNFMHQGEFILSGNGSWRFIGMMQGHWLAYKAKPPSDPEGVSAGISCIIPAHLILDIINCERFVEMRKDAEKRPPPNAQPIQLTSRDKPKPTQKTKAGATISVLTKDEFFKSLEKATRRRKNDP